MPRTHYDNLQVSRTASDRVIRAAYKSLAQEWHPDKHPQDTSRAERITKIINQAYKVLSDPRLRREHDDWIAREEQKETLRNNSEVNSDKAGEKKVDDYSPPQSKQPKSRRNQSANSDAFRREKDLNRDWSAPNDKHPKIHWDSRNNMYSVQTRKYLVCYFKYFKDYESALAFVEANSDQCY